MGGLVDAGGEGGDGSRVRRASITTATTDISSNGTSHASRPRVDFGCAAVGCGRATVFACLLVRFFFLLNGQPWNERRVPLYSMTRRVPRMLLKSYCSIRSAIRRITARVAVSRGIGLSSRRRHRWLLQRSSPPTPNRR